MSISADRYACRGSLFRAQYFVFIFLTHIHYHNMCQKPICFIIVWNSCKMWINLHGEIRKADAGYRLVTLHCHTESTKLSEHKQKSCHVLSYIWGLIDLCISRYHAYYNNVTPSTSIEIHKKRSVLHFAHLQLQVDNHHLHVLLISRDEYVVKHTTTLIHCDLRKQLIII